MKTITEAQLIMKMQELVITHLLNGHGTNETIKIIENRGAIWRERATKLLKEIEENEAWLHAERIGYPVEHQIVLQDCLSVIEQNAEEIARIIES